MSEQNKIDEIKAVHAASNEMWYDILAANAYEYITYLLQEIERKDKALRFYADEETYEEKWVESAESWADPEIEGDRGEIAREAL